MRKCVTMYVTYPPPPQKGLRTQGPVFQNGVRPGVSLNLTKSATIPKITFFKTALTVTFKFALVFF